MAVPAGPTEKRYTGNGVTTIFPIPFLLIAASDLDVFIDGVEILSGFTITGAGNPTSTITFSVPPANLSSMLLTLNVPFERLNDYQENGDFLASTVNRDFDRIWQALKQLLRGSVRALTLGTFDVDGAGWYRAKGNGIRDLKDPELDQDAVTKRWSISYITSLLSTITGPVNLASNVLYLDPYGNPKVVQDMSTDQGPAMIGFNPSVDYLPNTIGDGMRGREQRTFANFEMLSNLGNVDALNTALFAGVARVAFVADSIIEGDRDGLYDNSTAATIMRVIREQNKNVTFVFGNFSLAGRGIGAYSDPNYKGIAGPDNPALGFYRPSGNSLNNQWPGGSVIGKSWMDHVKDFQPDIIIMMHGANDASGVGSANAAAWKGALDYQNTWAKVPSIAMGTAALPAVAAGFQNEIQVAADVVRGIARERNHTLIDINRIFHLMRDGTDVDNLFYIRNNDFVSYPIGWTPDVGATLAPVDVIGYALQGSGGALRSTQSQDANISAKFKMTNWETQTGNIRYRSLGTGSTQYTAQVTSGAIFLYYGAAIIGSAVISSIPNNTEVTLQIDVRGSLHRVFLNGVEAVSVYDYNNVRPGRYGVSISGGSGLVFELIAHLGNPYAVGLPMLTDKDIYGVDDFVANPNSLGGNAINHPTKLANTMIWAAAFSPLIHHIRGTPNYKVVAAVLPFRASSSTAFDVAGATLQVSVDSTLLGSVTGIHTTPTGASAYKYDCRSILGGRTVPVAVILSVGPTSLINVDVVLPAGTWLLTVCAQFTKDSAGTYRNSMTVTGVRIP